jgi:ketosteroid isomerase-like protein
MFFNSALNMRTILLIKLLLLLSHSIFAQNNDKSEILSVLENQRIAWNNGNLQQYMMGYWQSDSLLFVGKRGPQYGWQKTFDNYKKSYPDKSAMGKLTFNILKVDVYTSDYAFVLGEWILDREKDQPRGFFTLQMKKINGQWKVIADHSS